MPFSGAEAWRIRARPCFGTRLVLKLRGLERGDADRAINAGFALAARLHEEMSRQSPASELARIAALAPGEGLLLKPDTAAVLRLALEMAAASDGLFDPVMPGPDGRVADWRDLDLSPQGELRVGRRLRLSLDGIAKGWAADRLCELLIGQGASDAIIDAGGDLALDCRQPQRIALRDPKHPGRPAAVIAIAKGGVATSAGYGGISDLWRGTGAARAWQGSVTVEAPDCATADALTKVLGAGGPDPARWAAKLHEFQPGCAA